MIELKAVYGKFAVVCGEEMMSVGMDNIKRARWMLVASMTVFGTLAIFVRNITLGSGELALYRAILAVLLIGGYLVLTGQRLLLNQIGREAPLLLASGAAMGINWLLLFEAYKYTTVSVATLSYYFAPVIVTAVCPFLFRERLTVKQIICFIMSTLGLVLIIGVGDLAGGGTDMKGICFGLGAAVFYATVMLMNKFIKSVDGINRTLLQFIGAIVVLAPYVLLTSGCNLGTLDGLGWGCLLIVGIIHTGITYCLYFSSLKELPGQKAAILSYIDPLVAVIVSVGLLGEPLTAGQAVGGTLVLGFTLWNEITPQKAA